MGGRGGHCRRMEQGLWEKKLGKGGNERYSRQKGRIQQVKRGERWETETPTKKRGRNKASRENTG